MAKLLASKWLAAGRTLLALNGHGKLSTGRRIPNTYRVASNTIDCWIVQGPPAEHAIQDVRDLEPPPTHHPRIKPLKANQFALPLTDASGDVVVFGFGTHEIPCDGPLQKVFQEARRILKPGGKVLMFEHGYDFHNYLIFGPVIHHVTTRGDWPNLLREHFANVQYARSSYAVDLFAGDRSG